MKILSCCYQLVHQNLILLFIQILLLREQSNLLVRAEQDLPFPAWKKKKPSKQRNSKMRKGSQPSYTPSPAGQVSFLEIENIDVRTGRQSHFCFQLNKFDLQNAIIKKIQQSGKHIKKENNKRCYCASIQICYYITVKMVGKKVTKPTNRLDRWLMQSQKHCLGGCEE